MTINFFSKSETYRKFSNIAPFPIELDGQSWPSTAGVGADGTGQNRLGLLFMRIRSELRGEAP